MMKTIESIAACNDAIVMAVAGRAGSSDFELQLYPTRWEECRYGLTVTHTEIVVPLDPEDFFDSEDDLEQEFMGVAGRDIDTAPSLVHLASKIASYIEARRVEPNEIEARLLASQLRSNLVA